ncbi:low molecular weight protein-tyrosine-phosphatase [Fructilactobacillus florum]|uniref:low molecular weight protein-tyrosine-phosphatase n=1 Tax=Fructilactobacillus florum TaxID=640331 RepID=UPI00028C2B61|nr:low molecular weight protein-tyrosine-phosphatase [Fructilactobacillus florum]EKK20109.1 Low molecular weight protein tyrosine phosphatase [Fructilactobacillus florum 2F]
MRKINVIFICLGNICRSPLAAALFEQLTINRGVQQFYQISSAATSATETGNPPHLKAQACARKHNLNIATHRAHRVTDQELEQADYLITMDQQNLADLQLRLGSKHVQKLHLCLEVLNHEHPASIADPWYTNNFTLTYQQLQQSLPRWLTSMEQQRTQEANNGTI